MMQLVPGARVVWPAIWPPPAGPQVDVVRKTGKSAALVPETAPCAIPVSGTFPVLVSTNTWAGQVNMPHPRVALPNACEVGVRLAAMTGAAPVPDNATGEPLTATLAVMVTVPVFAPVDVGENVMVIVQVAPAFKVAMQVPPDRAN